MGNNTQKIDMQGQKIGKLTVIREKTIDEYPNHKRKCVEWYCDCDCGNKNVVIKGVDIRRKHTLSCGCLNSEMSVEKNTYNLIGKTFGELTVVSKANKPTHIKARGAWWNCNCSCGNKNIVVRGNSLKTGNTISCGCIVSKNEYKIRQLLIKYNVDFKSQFIFKDLKNPETGYYYKFDFAIFNNNKLILLIEYDGEQHEQLTRFSPNEEENLRKLANIQKSDKLKNQYCEIHSIPLLRINYKSAKNVEELVVKILKIKGVI